MMKRLILLAMGVAGVITSLSAQQNMTLYQMHEIVQSNSLNPAIPSDCKWVVGIPALGSFSAAIASPVSYNDLGAGDDVIHGDKLLSKLKKTNVVSANVSVNLLTLGYRSQKMYYQFTVNERVNAIGSFAKDPVNLLFNGNAAFVGQSIKADPSVSGMYYREYAFSATRDFGKNLWVGARAKLLFGRLGISSTDNTANLYTDPGTYDLTLTTSLLIRAAIKGDVTVDANGVVDDFDTDIRAEDLLFSPSNVGGALDLGVSKTLESGWKLSGSVLNLGMISWSKNTHTFRQNTRVVYSGPTAGVNSWDDLLDTLETAFDLKYDGTGGYTQWLSPVVMAGASYPVARHIRVGLTGMAEFQSGVMPWALTATAFTEGLSCLSAGVSYTITRNSFANVGLALGVRAGAFTFHCLTDNVLAAFSPFDYRYATVQFGFSLRFGCGRGNKDKGDDTCARYAGLY